MQATPADKLGRQMPPYVILGACNPAALADQALTVEPGIGLLLPCNIVIRADPRHTGEVIVEVADSRILLGVTGRADMQPVAEQASRRLPAALRVLKSAGRPPPNGGSAASVARLGVEDR